MSKIVIGYDLNDSYAQISFMTVGVSEPETASMVLGAEQFNIPVALRKKAGTRLWLYGKDALMEEGCFTHLLSLVVKNDEVTVEGELFDPASLLAVFIKRSLSILTMQVNAKNIAAFMFTTPKLSSRIVEVFEQVTLSLDLPPERVFLQSYRESIYQYIVHQPKELWSHQVLLFDFSSHMKLYRMEGNKKTTPMVVFIENESFPELCYSSEPSERTKREWDGQFLAIAEQVIKGRIVSSVFLVGEGFKDEWANEALKYLCMGRRVFRGNNLYSKGACFGAMEKVEPSEIGASMVFLGEDKLKANVGVRVLRNGIVSYFAVLDAGKNWYECGGGFEIILDEEPGFSLIITSLTGGVVVERQITLDGLPERPARTTRLRVDVYLESADVARVLVTDLGFGEVFPASGREWSFEVEVV